MAALDQLAGVAATDVGTYTVTTIDTASDTPTTVSTTAASAGNVTINNAGQVGYTEQLQDGTLRAALWTADTGTQLLPLLPGSTQSQLIALNDNGDAIGWSDSTLVY